jgi:hypothetical protein
MWCLRPINIGSPSILAFLNVPKTARSKQIQLQEVVRLGERALCPQQERWPYRLHTREISFRPDHWKDSEIRDLLWLEDELSGCLLDLYERCRPGALERRAMNLIMRSRKVA